jgi:hypothetical protein
MRNLHVDRLLSLKVVGSEPIIPCNYLALVNCNSKLRKIAIAEHLEYVLLSS